MSLEISTHLCNHHHNLCHNHTRFLQKFPPVPLINYYYFCALILGTCLLLQSFPEIGFAHFYPNDLGSSPHLNVVKSSLIHLGHPKSFYWPPCLCSFILIYATFVTLFQPQYFPCSFFFFCIPVISTLFDMIFCFCSWICFP